METQNLEQEYSVWEMKAAYADERKQAASKEEKVGYLLIAVNTKRSAVSRLLSCLSPSQ